MKKLLLSVFIFSSSFSISDAQTWLWAGQAAYKSGGSGDAETSHCIVTDKSGNTYMTGNYAHNMGFGTYTVNGYAIDLIKYDLSGNVVWAKQGTIASALGNGEGYGLALDGSGNIYMTGYFMDTITLGAYTLKSKGYQDFFIAKYDPSGNVLWAKQATLASTASIGIGQAASVDGAGNVYATGEFVDTLQFGPYMLKSAGNLNCVFLVKYSTSGAFIWARQGILPSKRSSGIGYSVATETGGNTYMAGSFDDTISFGPLMLNNSYPHSSVNPFLVKYDSAGSVIWARQGLPLTASSFGWNNSVSLGGDGYLYTCGTFGHSMIFGTDTLMLSPSTFTCHLLKYDTAGNVKWAKFGLPLDNNDWNGFAVTTDTLSRGGGHMTTNANLGTPYPPFSIKIGTDTFSIPSKKYGSAGVIFRFDSAGAIECGSVFTEGNEDDGDALATDRAGKYVCMAGDIYDTAVFGKDTLTDIEEDLPFIARWQPCGFSNEGVQTVQSVSASVMVYPNPSKGAYTFEVKSEKLKVNSSVEVYNMLGEKVYSSSLLIPGSSFQINLNSQPTGIYLYRIISENGDLIGTGKLIKE